jgi:hypothetical protein
MAYAVSIYRPGASTPHGRKSMPVPANASAPRSVPEKFIAFGRIDTIRGVPMDVLASARAVNSFASLKVDNSTRAPGSRPAP